MLFLFRFSMLPEAGREQAHTAALPPLGLTPVGF
jgi:hypothetical protein